MSSDTFAARWKRLWIDRDTDVVSRLIRLVATGLDGSETGRRLAIVVDVKKAEERIRKGRRNLNEGFEI